MAMQTGTHEAPVITQVPRASGAGGSNQRVPPKCVGPTLVVFGVIDAVIGVTYLIYQFTRLSSTDVYSGVWGGLFMIGTGCVAIAAGRTRLEAPVIAGLVMSLISILLAITLQIVLKTEEISTYSALIPFATGLGFICFLTTSILSCVDLCWRNCCNNSPSNAAVNTQMVMLSPDGKIVPVQVIDASGIQQAASVESDYTPLKWRNGQHNTPVQHSAPPPAYTPSPQHLPNYALRAAPHQLWLQSRVYHQSCLHHEIDDSALDPGTYLHPPALQDEDGYEEAVMKMQAKPTQRVRYGVMPARGKARQKDKRSKAVQPRPQHPSPPPTVDDGSYADVKY